MARDIEDFLRRAAERRQQKAAGNAPPPKPQRQSPRPAQPRPVERKAQRPVTPGVVQPQSLRKKSPIRPSLRSGSVSDHVSQHIDSSSIARHADNLGGKIARAKSEIDTRVHQHLDHDISRIDDKPTITGQPSPAIFGALSPHRANDLRKVLSDPQSIGQAIIIAEILKRPNFDGPDHR